MHSEKTYYDEYWRGTRGWKPTDALDRPLQKWLERTTQQGSVVLDIGCGDGTRYGGWLVNKRKVILKGVDLSAVAVESAKQQGIDAHVIDDAVCLPFASNEFDTVLCFEVLSTYSLHM